MSRIDLNIVLTFKSQSDCFLNRIEMPLNYLKLLTIIAEIDVFINIWIENLNIKYSFLWASLLRIKTLAVVLSHEYKTKLPDTF